jgi:hypothetical protein
MSGPEAYPAAGYMATPERACSDCKHREVPAGWREPTCGRRKVAKGYDPVTGTTVATHTGCVDERMDLPGRCRTGGVFWEAP